MTTRHIAVLVLVGWYLVAPPLMYDAQRKETGKVAEWLPLSEWENLRPFTTARECQDYRENQIAWLLKNPELGRSRSSEEQRHLDAHRQQLNLSQCIAGGDRRLKE